MTAMAPKRAAGKWEQLVYLDLLAGPGRGIDRDSGMEFDGSPLRALRVTPPFDRLIFGDRLAGNVAALRRRVPPQDQMRTEFHVGDCNALVQNIVGALSLRALGLAFVDPEGFEVAFDTFRALATRRIDVLFLFPSGIGIRRNLRKFARQTSSPMDRLWDGPEWRELPPAKLAAGRQLNPDEALSHDRPWVLRFRSKMADIGFQYQDEADPYFRNEKNVLMYHLLYFSRDPAGLTIWRNIKKIEPSGQRAFSFA
jgi:three-Cys-motif partner protein